jgi:chromatin remodeling complex protein RSC6
MTKQAQSKTETVSATASSAAAPAAKVQKDKAPKVAKVSAPVAAAPAVAVASAPVVAAAKVQKDKAPKAAKVVAPVVVAAVPAASAVVVADAAEASTVSSEFSDFMTKLQQLGALISTLKTEFRSLEKKASRELKTATKASSKRKRKTGNRSPSGFVKPTLISDELASFLGKTKGTEMARTEVTREINAYIRANQLQDKANGRRIIADTKLTSLLKLASGEELTYFNLQRYMSPHFAKSAAAVTATA